MPKDTKTLCIKKGCASVLTQPLTPNIFKVAENFLKFRDITFDGINKVFYPLN